MPEYLNPLDKMPNGYWHRINNKDIHAESYRARIFVDDKMYEELGKVKARLDGRFNWWKKSSKLWNLWGSNVAQGVAEDIESAKLAVMTASVQPVAKPIIEQEVTNFLCFNSYILVYFIEGKPICVGFDYYHYKNIKEINYAMLNDIANQLNHCGWKVKIDRPILCDIKDGKGNYFEFRSAVHV